MESRLSNPKSLLFIEALCHINPQSIYLVDAKTQEGSGVDATKNDATKNDFDFLQAIARGAEKEPDAFNSGYDNLLRLARTADHQHFNLYNRDTCQEFHRLLVFLVTNYQENLRLLVDPERKPEFQAVVGRVYWTGGLLDALFTGTALPTHLKNMEDLELLFLKEPEIIHNSEAMMPYLLDSRTEGMPISSPAHGQDGELHFEARRDQDEVDESDEALDQLSQILADKQDVEVETVQPRVEPDGIQARPMWRVFLAWLKLMVVHFRASHIIISHLNSNRNYPIVSIKLLEHPLLDNTTIDTKKLFNQYIPPAGGNASDRTTNDDILSFLDTIAQSNPRSAMTTMRISKELWSEAATTEEKKKVASTIKPKIESVRDSSVPACYQLGVLLCDILEKWVAGWIRPEEDHVFISSITTHLDALWQNCLVFNQLSKKQVGFSGSVHCEACLASLLSQDCLADLEHVDEMTAEKLKAIVQELKVGHAKILFTSLC
jgi:hypothetical protein